MDREACLGILTNDHTDCHSDVGGEEDAMCFSWCRLFSK